MSGRKYTQGEKLAYYKRRAAANNRVSGYGAYHPTAKRPAHRVYKAPPPPPAKASKKKGGALSSAGGSLGSMAGSAIGGAPGAAIGKFLGGKLGHLVEQITGFGDYHVEENSIMNASLQPPEVVNTMNKGGVVLRHREYIGDVLATTVFTLQKYVVQPGLVGTFPWLSQIAGSFEQYKWRGILFEFVSTSSDALLSSATSQALGTVNMSTIYNVTDPDFTDKRAMLNHEYSNSSKPSCSFIHPVECARNQTPYEYYMTRGSAVPAAADPARYDFANFYVMTEGQQAAGGVLGELWVTYEIELIKAQFDNIVLTDHFRLGSVTNVAPLGTAVVGSNLGNGGTIGGLINGAGTAYSFPPLLGSGSYEISYFVQGGTATVTAPTLNYTNCQSYLPRLLSNSSVSSVQAPENGRACNQFMMTIYLQITAQGAAVTFGGAGTLPTGVTAGDLVITQISNTLI